MACLYFLPEQSPFGKGGEGGCRKGAAAAASGANMKDEAFLPPVYYYYWGPWNLALLLRVCSHDLKGGRKKNWGPF